MNRLIHARTAGLIAQVAAQSNVPRLIHVSHLNASPTSPSAFYRTKHEGERAVRGAFPEATIVRPAWMFGAEDWLLNAAARAYPLTSGGPLVSNADNAEYPILFKLNGGRTKFSPVHVLDVAAAMTTMLSAPITSTASTFALPGPAVHTFRSIETVVSAMTMQPVSSAPMIPKAAAQAIAGVLQRVIWWPTISPDEVERKYINDVGADALTAVSVDEKPAGWGSQGSGAGMTGVDGEAFKTWADLDMTPDFIEEHAIKYLRRYRNS